MTYVYKKINSPVGELTLIASDIGLAAILWEKDNPERVKIKAQTEQRNHPYLLQTEKQLREYFQGDRKHITVPLHLHGTDFQKEVWRALTQIPYGETRTYGQIAASIGRPKAVRAVGAANGKNPVSIIAACHRVIGADGSLTGFAGGLEVKAALLKLESHYRP